MECLFCKIIEGTIPSEIIFENENVIAIRDINPQAPLHVLLMPKTHVRRLSELDNPLIQSALFAAVAEFVAREQLEDDGYRIVVNTGRDGQQTVDHLHLHLLAGRQLQWPPG